MVNLEGFLSLRITIVTRQVNYNRTKIGGKWQNSKDTFLAIFIQCEPGVALKIDSSLVDVWSPITPDNATR